MLTENQIRNDKNQLLALKRGMVLAQKHCKKGGKKWVENKQMIAILSAKIKTYRVVLKGNAIDYKKLKTKKEIRSFVLKMTQIKSLVREILKHDLESRDDDNLLCIKVWEKQGSKPNMAYNTFKTKLIIGTFSSPESIGRCRRALQQKYITLRGKLYEKRHQAEERFKTQYKLEF